MFLGYCLILEADAWAILSIPKGSAKDIRLTRLDIWSADIFTVSQAATKTELQQSNGGQAWQLNQTSYRENRGGYQGKHNRSSYESS